MARVGPRTVALLSALLLTLLALTPASILREPDAYAYRASTMSLLEGTGLVLSRAEYIDLDTRLRALGDDGWEGRVGIEMWVALSEDAFTTEKAIGYPILLAPFAALGIPRLGPLVFGGLACLGLWGLGRRWLGEPAAGLAVGGFCLSSGVVLMAHRHYMPTFTTAALLLAGISAAGWCLIAADAPKRRRGLAGILGLILLGLATLTRATNLPALLLTAALLAWCLPWRRWRIGWLVTALACCGLLLVSNHLVFGHPLHTGYRFSHSETSLSPDAIPVNIQRLVFRLLIVLPLYPLALLTAWRRRREPIVWLLVGCWGSVWGIHLMHEWIGTQGDRQHWILTTRFFIAAAGPIALLAADTLRRLPRRGDLLVLAGLALLSAATLHQTLETGWGFVDRQKAPSRRTIPSVSYQP